jgi:ABC-2 type transport system permease protein
VTAALTATAPAGRGDARLVLHQARYELIGFWRNPQSRFFTLLLPIIFLVIFSTVIGGKTTTPTGVKVNLSVYYVPGIATMAIVAASLVNLTVSIVTQRETGILKRRRATPVPAWVLIAGRAAVAVLVALAVVAAIIVIGRLAFGVPVPGSTLPGVVVATVVGAFTFCSLAFALSTFIGAADAAQPILQFITLPLYFISGVFVPDANDPAWLRDVANVFPVRHLAQAELRGFDPGAAAPGIATSHLVVLAAWGVAALAVAVRRFRWSPQ